MSVLQLSLNEARHLHLAAQGLLKKPPTSRSPERYSFHHPADVAAANRYHQRGGPQPYLVLFSRLGKYPPTGWMSLWRVAS